jgi:hypothetical protein
VVKPARGAETVQELGVEQAIYETRGSCDSEEGRTGDWKEGGRIRGVGAELRKFFMGR